MTGSLILCVNYVGEVLLWNVFVLIVGKLLIGLRINVFGGVLSVSPIVIRKVIYNG